VGSVAGAGSVVGAGSSVVDGGEGSSEVGSAGIGTPGGSVAAAIQGEPLLRPKHSIRALTCTQRGGCVCDGWHIARWAAGIRAVPDSEVPVLSGAQAVHVHCCTRKRARIVQGLSVTCLLSGCQSWYPPRRPRQRDGIKRRHMTPNMKTSRDLLRTRPHPRGSGRWQKPPARATSRIGSPTW
jgi:hypothetical protein